MSDESDKTERNVTGMRLNALTEDEIDLNLMGSFPASDPPSWTLGIPRPEATEEKET